MQTPVFFFYQDSDGEAVRATGIGTHTLGWASWPVGKTLRVGIANVEHIEARTHINNLHPKLLVFPGPHGKLAKKHVDHIASEFPNAKEGDAFSTVLSALHELLGMEAFNPNAY